MNSFSIALFYSGIVILIILLFYFALRRVFDKEGYDQHGFNLYGFNKKGNHRNGTELDDKKFNFRGFNILDLNHRNGTLFDEQGYDFHGYNQKGNNHQGFNRKGFHFQTHHHINGTYYNEAGFDYLGFDKKGFNGKGLDKDGFNVKGIDTDGYNRKGFNALGYDREGFDQKGFNQKGYDRSGFDRSGFNAKGFDSQGFDAKGLDKNGFNKFGFNQDGYNRNGLDQFGFDRKGNSEEGPWWSLETKNKEIISYIEKFKDLKPPYRILSKIKPVFLNNAFNILGLPTHSLGKDIHRRGLELAKLAAIKQNMAYPSDYCAVHLQRDENSIKGAASLLQQPVNSLVESFFWFYTVDSTHEKIFQTFKESNFLYALFQWNRLYQQNNSPESLLNLALAESILYEITHEDIFLTYALKHWSKLIKNSSIMNQMIELFQTQGMMLDLSQGESIQTKVVSRIAELFYQLSQIFSDEVINQHVIKTLNFYPTIIIQKTITPVLQEIKSITEELDNHELFKFTGESKSHAKILNVSESKIKSLLKKIDMNYDIIQLYQYENQSESKTIFENLSQKIRNLAIFIANKTGDDESNGFAKSLLKKALLFCQSEMLKKKIQNDMQDIEEAEQIHEYTESILYHIKNESFSSARNSLEQLQSYSSNSKVQEIIRVFRGLIRKKEAEYKLERAIGRLKSASNTGYGFFEARSEVKLALLELVAMETDFNNKIKLLELLKQLE